MQRGGNRGAKSGFPRTPVSRWKLVSVRVFGTTPLLQHSSCQTLVGRAPPRCPRVVIPIVSKCWQVLVPQLPLAYAARHSRGSKHGSVVLHFNGGVPDDCRHRCGRPQGELHTYISTLPERVDIHTLMIVNLAGVVRLFWRFPTKKRSLVGSRHGRRPNPTELCGGQGRGNPRIGMTRRPSPNQSVPRVRYLRVCYCCCCRYYYYYACHPTMCSARVLF